MPLRHLFLLLLVTWGNAGEVDRMALANDLGVLLTFFQSDRTEVARLATACALPLPVEVLSRVKREVDAAEEVQRLLRDHTVPLDTIPWQARSVAVQATANAWTEAKRRLQIIEAAPNSYRAQIETEAYARYLSFLRAEVPHLLDGRMAFTGGQSQAFEKAITCHHLTLDLLAYGKAAAVRWPHVPPDHALLIEFNALVEKLLARVESALQQSSADPDPLLREAAVLEVRAQVLDTEEHRLNEPSPTDPADPLVRIHDQLLDEYRSALRHRIELITDPVTTTAAGMRLASSPPRDEILLGTLVGSVRTGLRAKPRLQQRYLGLTEALAAAPGEVRQLHHQAVVALAQERDRLEQDRLAALNARDHLTLLTIEERELRLDRGYRDLASRIEQDRLWHATRMRWNVVPPGPELAVAIAAAEDAHTTLLTAIDRESACDLAWLLVPEADRRTRLRRLLDPSITPADSGEIAAWAAATAALDAARRAVTEAQAALNPRVSTVERLLRGE